MKTRFTRFRAGLVAIGLIASSCGPANPTEPPPMRSLAGVPWVGSIVRLSNEDRAHIERLFMTGEKPWLFCGDSPYGPGIDAFLPPTISLPTFRRGAIVHLDNQPLPTKPRVWKVGRHESYAQVAVEGRPFDEILHERDINRPFRVEGSFDDSELLSVVGYVRSQPFFRLENLPITSVWRSPDGAVYVKLGLSPTSGKHITLFPQGQTWKVLGVTSFMV